MSIHPIFFTHSSVNGHLGCFYVLAIVSKSAVDMGGRYPFNSLFSLSLDKYLELELLDHTVVLLLTF